MEPSPQPTPLPPLPVEAVHDLSMVGLFLAADPIVQGVMVLLALASVACWAIILDKLFRVGGLRRQARMLESVAQAPTLARRPGETSGLAGAVCAVAQEAWADWTEGQESRAEYRDRLERAMRARVAAGAAPRSSRACRSWPPWARRRPSSACSAPSGAS